MLAAVRQTIGNARARVRRLTREPDPVLLLGRERRWQWPWAVLGLATTGLLFVLLMFPAGYFEDFAVQRRWVLGEMPRDVFPLDPVRPATAVDSLLVSLPFLLAPLFTLWAVHGVSWRRAFSYGGGFDWRQFWRAASALMVLAVLGASLSYLLEPQQHQFPTRGPSYIPWVLLALGVIFVQTIGEDVLFKGYLLRVLGAVVPLRIPLTGAVIALFVMGHLWNDDFRRDLVLNAIYFTAAEVVAFAVLFRTRNLAAAAGLHWMNNVFATLAPTVPGQPTVLALAVYTDPVYAAGGSRLFDLATHAAGVAGFALLLVMLMWRRSPFYLAQAPRPAPSESVATPRDADIPARS